MNDQEYQETQNALNLIARMISGLDLTGFLKRIEQADSVAPFLTQHFTAEEWSGCTRLKSWRKKRRGYSQHLSK